MGQKTKEQEHRRIPDTIKSRAKRQRKQERKEGTILLISSISNQLLCKYSTPLAFAVRGRGYRQAKKGVKLTEKEILEEQLFIGLFRVHDYELNPL